MIIKTMSTSDQILVGKIKDVSIVAVIIHKKKVYKFGCSPTQDSSHHQDYYFFRKGIPITPCHWHPGRGNIPGCSELHPSVELDSCHVFSPICKNIKPHQISFNNQHGTNLLTPKRNASLSFPGPKISTVAEPSSPWRPAKTCRAVVVSGLGENVTPQKMVF